MRVSRHGIAVLAAVLGAGAPAAAQEGEREPAAGGVRHVVVQGRGEVRAVPDRADVTAGFFALDPDLQQAKRTVDAGVSRLVAAARGLGVAPEAIRAATLVVEPRWSGTESGALRFEGYAVTRTVSVRLAGLDRLDALIEAAIGAGANTSWSIDLGVEDEAALEARAMDAAVADARRQAERLANGFGARLGPIRVVRTTGRPVPMPYEAAAMKLGGGPGGIEPGTIAVTSQVEADFFLE